MDLIWMERRSATWSPKGLSFIDIDLDYFMEIIDHDVTERNVFLASITSSTTTGWYLCLHVLATYADYLRILAAIRAARIQPSDPSTQQAKTPADSDTSDLLSRSIPRINLTKSTRGSIGINMMIFIANLGWWAIYLWKLHGVFINCLNISSNYAITLFLYIKSIRAGFLIWIEIEVRLIRK